MLEHQLSEGSSRLANELSAKVQLMKEIGEAERRADERKAFLDEEKVCERESKNVKNKCKSLV